MPTSEPSLRPIRLWLWSVAALVFLMVIVGGATRLTESGLSIVEWKPVTGTLPPLSQAEWQAEFEKYQAIPQYQLVNRGMSLAEFKTIFWWEWGHRLLGRLVGAAFLIPFLWFLWRGAIRPGLRGRLWAIFALGGVQGGVGWWMVASGLADRIHVSHYRLAFHLTLACLIYAAVVWTAERLDARAAPAAPRIRAGAILLAVLTLVQIYLGALVAGLRAGLIHDTWPLIEGRLIPPAAELFFAAPWWVNLFENALTVQFNHRMAGYLLWIAALAHAADAWRQGRGPVFTRALLLFGAVTVQAALGIFTLLYHVPLLLALAHQGVAMIVLTIAIVHAERVSPAAAARAREAFAGGRA
jgi:cytochrome c oxidase assembly protein subunit 15